MLFQILSRETGALKAFFNVTLQLDMMSAQIEKNVSLLPYNTFGIDVNTAFFSKADQVDALKESLVWAKENSVQPFILGGGSNVLLTKHLERYTIRNNIRGIEKIAEDVEHIYIKCGAGESWHQFVMYCLDHNYAGVENLALIPGLVGASPMQNIGAYGVEIKEVFHELTAVHTDSLEEVKFSNSDCAFNYRESVFKNRYKNQFVITDVTYRLNKTPHFNISYGAIQQELEKAHVTELSIRAVANAVMSIRTAKLPNPKQIGNAGSFFKNPSVSKDQYAQLKAQYPQLVAYENADQTMKLAAGWLIEQCGLKGYRKGDAGVHALQALVLVNYGTASGRDVLQVCTTVQTAVAEKFGVDLRPEVNIL
ncbi:UDP-N-acetylmuramate dehydrogenase [Niabella insulamsoli]|uniref:UDP-N-acetylmuramate dehydrogenase n=1 Tax=Niabella insulamsoli TaxID=3144874 RepID=UPI0031FE14F3